MRKNRRHPVKDVAHVKGGYEKEIVLFSIFALYILAELVVP